MIYIRKANYFPLKLTWKKKYLDIGFKKKSYPSLPSCITEEYKILLIVVGFVCLPL